MKWLFELGEKVELVASNESGSVIGRAEYLASERSYLIRYMAADGRLVEQWWGESAIQTTLEN